MAILLDGDDAEIPLFGPHLDRTVIPLALDARGTVHAADWRFSYLLAHQTTTRTARVLADLVRCHDLLWSAPGPGMAWQLYRCD